MKQVFAVVLIFPNVLAFTFSVNFTVRGIFHVRGKLQTSMLLYMVGFDELYLLILLK